VKLEKKIMKQDRIERVYQSAIERKTKSESEKKRFCVFKNGGLNGG
jgi:hypothetical protein